jgi:hypothetical protein
MSRTARQARNSPKRIDPCSPRSACSSRTTSAKLGTPARRHQRPKPRHQLAKHHSPHPRPSHTRRAQSSEIQCRSSAVSSPRQRDRHITVHCRSNVPHDPARSVASSVTAVQAHPSRINAPSEDGAPNLTSVQTPSNTRGVQRHFTFRPPKRPVRSDRPGFTCVNPKVGRDLGNEFFHPRERPEERTERRTRHGLPLPESISAHVFEPTGRSQTTSPMGFVAFRRNQHR